ncbi:MAG: CYTH and CHAD domain-containing protein [Rhodocyclaceae bacterium]|nr:MAG: CYTH and CHAD domain-containing protein [Rhodocyclaceae bacterium]
MGKEIELKLSLRSDQHGRLVRHPLLTGAASRQSTTLVNRYYDTPNLALHRHGVALRLRQDGKRWLQTVKCAGNTAGGLSIRPEWEKPYRNTFDFSGINDKKVRKLLHNIQEKLIPIFETNFKRVTWHLYTEAGDHILATLDRGEITAAGKSTPISEVELELSRGSVESLFSVADALCARIAMTPSPCSKAERGYRLFSQSEDIVPTKIRPVTLAPEMHPVSAFRLTCLSCLEHLQKNQSGALLGEDPEYLHQMRVASRRLDAALRFFRPLLPLETYQELNSGLKQVLKVLGHARDMDVLMTEIIAPVLQDNPRALDLARMATMIGDKRKKIRDEMVAYLESPTYGRFLLHTIKLINDIWPGGITLQEGMQNSMPLNRYARKRVRALLQDLARTGCEANITDPPTLHALRIRVKRLRYALDFVAHPHLPTKQLACLQDELGWLNDLSNAGMMLLSQVHADPTLFNVVSQIGEWHLPHYKKITKDIGKHLETFLIKTKGIHGWT